MVEAKDRLLIGYFDEDVNEPNDKIVETKTLDTKLIRKEAKKINGDRIYLAKTVVGTDVLINALSIYSKMPIEHILLFNLIGTITFVLTTIMAYKSINQTYDILVGKYENSTV